QLGGEVVFDAVFFHAAERRVGNDDVNSVGIPVILVGAGESVVVSNVGGSVDAVQNHVGHGQHMRQSLLLHATNRLYQSVLVFPGLDVLVALMVNGAGKETACTAGWVQDDLLQ